MPIIMGRKTFESMNSKPLPGRVNIIITRQEDWKADGVITVKSLEEAKTAAEDTDCKEAFVIGGGEIFSLAMKDASKIYLTRVHISIDGDVFFPAINASEWELAEKRDCSKDEKHAFNFTIEQWRRNV